MPQNWVKSKLAKRIEKLSTADGEKECIVLERWPDGSVKQVVDVDTFVSTFGAAILDNTKPDKHAALKAVDGGIKGYARFFDEWKAAGEI